MKNFKKFIFVFSLLSIYSFVIYLVEYYPYKGTDDAYIYFQYAKNFTNGHGFVYAPGGERVEGFTSILWLLFIIVTYSLSPSYFQYILIIINLILISYALFRIVYVIDRFYDRSGSRLLSVPSIFFLGLVLITKGYIDWTVFSLLETGLWSALLIVICCILFEYANEPAIKSYNRGLFTFLIALLVLTRPESLLFGGVLILILGWIAWHKTKRFKAGLLEILLPLIVFIFTAGALTGFRLIYFGYPFPNTYYAKVSVNRIYNLREGVSYFLKFLYVYPVYFIPVAISIISAYGYFRMKKILSPEETRFYQAQIVTVMIISLTMMVPLLTGGDHFPLFRLYQPLIPVLILVIFNFPFFRHFFIYTRNQSSSHRIYFMFIALMIFVYLANLPKYLISSERMPYKISMLNEFSFAEKNRKESLMLNEFFNFEPKPSIGQIWAGGFAFGYEGPTIDLMGLNNTMMAHATREKVGLKNHAAFDKNTFYKLKADLILISKIDDTSKFVLPENKPGFDESFDNFVLKNIYRDERFISMYKPVILTKKNNPNYFYTYSRIEFIDSLRRNGVELKILDRTKPIE